MNATNTCSWCHVEAEADGQPLPRPKQWGANCRRHSDNITAAQTIFGASPAQPKGTHVQPSRITGLFGLLVIIFALACLLGCVVETKTLRTAQTNTVTGKITPPITGKQLNPEAAQLIEDTGTLFGPVGEAAAKCGLAVLALVLAGHNHRRLSKHLADSPGAPSTRATRPRAPASEPAT